MTLRASLREFLYFIFLKPFILFFKLRPFIAFGWFGISTVVKEEILFIKLSKNSW